MCSCVLCPVRAYPRLDQEERRRHRQETSNQTSHGADVVLATLEDPNDAGGGGGDGDKGCAFCGGLGHRVATCPKLEAHRMKQIMGGDSDVLAGSAGRLSL